MTATILIALAATVCVLFAGGAATEIGPWFRTLRQPGWKPPDWAFGPVWSTIGVFTCAAAVIAWTTAGSGAERLTVLGLFAVNAVFNILWSVLFFRQRRPDWALIEVVALWLSILALMIAFYPRAPWAAALLLPYLVWVSIASVLNLAIVRLNGPFGGVTAPGARRTGGIVEGQS
jgi:tryptophan-rich sensory protein